MVNGDERWLMVSFHSYCKKCNMSVLNQSRFTLERRRLVSLGSDGIECHSLDLVLAPLHVGLIHLHGVELCVTHPTDQAAGCRHQRKYKRIQVFFWGEG